MINPATIQDLVASNGLEAMRAGIVSELKRLLPGVTIVNHPGKLDINDLLEKAIVAAPGIALGWSRLRGVADVAGTYQLPIDWTAYVVTEDFADLKATPIRRVSREAVAWAIGARLLQILRDPHTPFWGLTGLTDPWPEPAPDMRPLLTMKSAENAAAVFVVTWTQALILQGTSPFDGATPGAVSVPPDGMEFDLPDGELPPQLRALFSDEDQAA